MPFIPRPNFPKAYITRRAVRAGDTGRCDYRAPAGLIARKWAIASIALRAASSGVAPWPLQPGSCGTTATKPPPSAAGRGFTSTVYSVDAIGPSVIAFPECYTQAFPEAIALYNAAE